MPQSVALYLPIHTQGMALIHYQVSVENISLITIIILYSEPNFVRVCHLLGPDEAATCCNLERDSHQS